MMEKEQVLWALSQLGSLGHVIRDTHGNVSMIDRLTGVMYIKPSGMAYGQITTDDVCAVNLVDGVSTSPNERKPSVDTPHHLAIYRNHPWIGAICHTHSPYAVGFAIADRDIPVRCTEHADYFGHEILIHGEPNIDSWGEELRLDRAERGVILTQHGVLTFADDPVEAVKLAAALEDIAFKNFIAHGLKVGGFPIMDPLCVSRWHERYMTKYGQ